jgi:hypothetical protein
MREKGGSLKRSERRNFMRPSYPRRPLVNNRADSRP